MIVLYEGEVAGEFYPSKTTETEIGLYMTGAQNMYREVERCHEN